MPRRIQFVIAIFVTLSVVGNITAQEGGAVATNAVAELQALRERHDRAWARLERLKQAFGSLRLGMISEKDTVSG
jgi:ferric-dicitrate binding protein FerR (iron transport regulator)